MGNGERRQARASDVLIPSPARAHRPVGVLACFWRPEIWDARRGADAWCESEK
jgi:hypothetical protein